MIKVCWFSKSPSNEWNNLKNISLGYITLSIGFQFYAIQIDYHDSFKAKFDKEYFNGLYFYI